MDLDDELGRLFADQRLDVPVRPGAVDAVVAGARRVRRRRVAVSSVTGVLAVSAMVAGGIALAGTGGPASLPPAATGPTIGGLSTTSAPPTTEDDEPAAPDSAHRTATATETGSPTPQRKDSSTPKPPPSSGQPSSTVPPLAKPIGPTAYGDVRLGMPVAEARDKGLLDDSRKQAVANGCLRFPMVIGGRDDGFAWGTEDGAIQMFVPYRVVRNPEGVTVGWTPEQVREKYASLGRQVTESGGVLTVAAPGATNVNYRFGFDKGALLSIAVEQKDQTCR